MMPLSLQNHVDRIFESLLAQEVSYNGATIRASIRYSNDLESSGYGQKAIAQIILRARDVNKPISQDSVRINDEIWLVDTILDGDGYVWTVKLKRDARGKVGS